MLIVVSLFRATEENILVTYKDSQSAMAATALNGEKVSHCISMGSLSYNIVAYAILCVALPAARCLSVYICFSVTDLPQVEGVKVEVSLRTPWPPLEGATSEGGAGKSDTPLRDSGQEHSEKVSLRKRLSLLAVTSDDGSEEGEVGSEVNEELLEFSYTADEPPDVGMESRQDLEPEYENDGMEQECDETEPENGDLEEGVSSSLSDIEEENTQDGHPEQSSEEEQGGGEGGVEEEREEEGEGENEEEGEGEGEGEMGGMKRTSPVVIEVHSATPEPSLDTPDKVCSTMTGEVSSYICVYIMSAGAVQRRVHLSRCPTMPIFFLPDQISLSVSFR